MSPTDTWPFYLLASLLVLLLLRLLRVADTASSTRRPSPDARQKSPWQWFRGRTLDKLEGTTALSRAHTELFHSKIDELQARHDLERLVSELQPPAQAEGPRHAPAATPNTAALSLTEIQDLLAVVQIDDATRADLLRLAAARLAEKQS